MSPSKRSRIKLVLTFCFAVFAMALFACEGGTADSEYPGPVSSQGPVSSPGLSGDEVTYPDDKIGDIPVSNWDTSTNKLYPPLWLPVPEDDKLIRGEAFINESSIMAFASYPPQFRLDLEGTMPTPCHELRIKVSDPNEQNQVHVDVYSLSKPDEICIQVLESFYAQVPLRGFPSGEYSVWVNGEEVGEINP